MFNTDISVMITNLATAFVPVLLGIILHEVAHGWVASKCGDQTARMLGRLTINPVPHIDPLGLGMFVLTAIAPGGFIFGWAKPVPVNPRNFKNPRRDDILVSLAGAVTNILLAIGFALILKLVFTFVPHDLLLNSDTAYFLMRMCFIGVTANFVLAWVNLMPIPPLDGSHVVANLLPPRLAWQYTRLGRYGFIIIVLLLATGILGRILYPLISFSLNTVFSLLGLLTVDYLPLLRYLGII